MGTRRVVKRISIRSPEIYLRFLLGAIFIKEFCISDLLFSSSFGFASASRNLFEIYSDIDRTGVASGGRTESGSVVWTPAEEEQDQPVWAGLFSTRRSMKADKKEKKKKYLQSKLKQELQRFDRLTVWLEKMDAKLKQVQKRKDLSEKKKSAWEKDIKKTIAKIEKLMKSSGAKVGKLNKAIESLGGTKPPKRKSPKSPKRKSPKSPKKKSPKSPKQKSPKSPKLPKSNPPKSPNSPKFKPPPKSPKKSPPLPPAGSSGTPSPIAPSPSGWLSFPPSNAPSPSTWFSPPVDLSFPPSSLAPPPSDPPSSTPPTTSDPPSSSPPTTSDPPSSSPPTSSEPPSYSPPSLAPPPFSAIPPSNAPSGAPPASHPIAAPPPSQDSKPPSSGGVPPPAGALPPSKGISSPPFEAPPPAFNAPPPQASVSPAVAPAKGPSAPTAEEIILSGISAKGLNTCSEWLRNSGVIYELTGDASLNATLLCAPDESYTNLTLTLQTLLADKTKGQEALVNLVHYQILTLAYTTQELVDQAPSTYETLLNYQPVNTTKSTGTLQFLPFPQGTQGPSTLLSPQVYQDNFVIVHVIDVLLIPPIELLDTAGIPLGSGARISASGKNP